MDLRFDNCFRKTGGKNENKIILIVFGVLIIRQEGLANKKHNLRDSFLVPIFIYIIFIYILIYFLFFVSFFFYLKNYWI